jgi:hypothetical protein
MGTGRSKMCRRRPTLPLRLRSSTIGAGGLNFRVRDGTGCTPSAMATETACPRRGSAFEDAREGAPRAELGTAIASASEESSPRPISTGQLHTSPCFHFPPINLVVCEGPYLIESVGDLISRRASHLDAFSAYPFRTWPTSRAAGATTGTPEVRPPRSSRTRGSSSQVSCAHSG